MKRLFAVILTLALPLIAFCAEEDQLLDVLRSGHSLQEKDAACSRLKWIGTPNSIPVLAGLLTNSDLSHSARYALESMPGPAAEEALIEALSKTSGSNEVGIINSLNVRADSAAAPDLAKLLADPDAEVAVAAAEALGKIGGADARQALQSAWGNSSSGPARVAQSDALLACGNRLLAARAWGQALPIFQELYDREAADHMRMAAYRGIILASEKHGLNLMLDAIAGDDAVRQGAALPLASRLDGHATTEALAALLSKVQPAVQIALLQCLDQRRDRVAEADVAELLNNDDQDVRLAALAALGDLGDGKVVSRIATQAAHTTGPEKTAARQALVDLRQGSVTPSFLRLLTTANGSVQAELIRALGDRGDSSAAPKILELAQTGGDSTRFVSLQALALVAGPSQISGLVQLVIRATNDDMRSDVADTLATACQRLQSQLQPLALEAGDLGRAVQSASLEARVALLAVCSSVSDPRIREDLRAAASDSDPRIRMAAKRAICNSQDEQLLPDILKVACEAKEDNFRLLGIAGCVRLITQDQTMPLPAPEKINALKAIANTSLNVQGKRLVLSGLGSIADLEALDLAKSMLDDPQVKVEASEATVQIARAVSGKHPVKAAAALRQVLNTHPDASVRKMAQAALRKIKKTK